MPKTYSETHNTQLKQPEPSRWVSIFRHIKRDRQLLLLFIPCIVFFALFRYGPMYGLIIAFKNYDVWSGITGSEWVGLEHFRTFFSSPDFFKLFKNTILLGFYTLLIGFPFPIIFAILLNEVRILWFKKSIQTVSFLPSFLSIVIVSSMLIDFLSPSSGIINDIIAALGFEKIYFLVEPSWFRTVYIGSDIWQLMGYESILYLAAIAGISPDLYEAAKVDGATRWDRIRYITLPGLMPTILILFIIKAGNMFRIGFEKILLIYNPMTYEVADVFSTYVYRQGLLQANYSYAAAVGLFEGIIALVMLLIANLLSRRLGGKSLW
ncbi:putative aldouronate transport system permease protein [Lederbergia wuyishanensis]|uniref:Aldouronate transport system permease protein n=1 Tax=Lederbergia wuyishanensis TaxID=1347903 RepID=A0ABU0D7N4_9BACI|nr:putative aldouronate transport system permease protein [Lederbergia wuyishanensis]